MQIVLLERVEKLGQMGEVVSVKEGYARNFLLPQRKALRATEENLKHFEAQRAQLEARNLELRNEAEKVGDKLDGQSFVVIRQSGETGILYGSVNSRDIANVVSENGFSVDRTQVALDRQIKN
ncbi:MAG TPA: 50S ribosomal protein L9, partial [Alphaproteobacteria bacterium]|nr:50S ribosomal protein L9 [Alphaproteobacteria bacterium]